MTNYINNRVATVHRKFLRGDAKFKKKHIYLGQKNVKNVNF